MNAAPDAEQLETAAARPAAFLSVGPDTRLEDEHKGIHRLLAPFSYYSAIARVTITVPTDFLTDYASVPRLVLAYLLFGGKGKRAALIHDWLYTCGQMPRDLCDDVFREALTVSGYSEFTIGGMYAGVRIGGADRYTAPNVEQEPHVEQVLLASGEAMAP